MLKLEVSGKDPLPRELQLILAHPCAELRPARQRRRHESHVDISSACLERGKKRQNVF